MTGFQDSQTHELLGNFQEVFCDQCLTTMEAVLGLKSTRQV